MKHLKVLMAVVFIFHFFIVSGVWAFESTSTTFQIHGSAIESISSGSSSTSFKNQSAGGQIATGISSNVNKIYSGILYWLFPSITVLVCGDGSCNGIETCSSCPGDCGSCGGGGSGGGSGPPPISTTTKVILQGKAYPAAYVTALKDGQVIANTQASTEANFKFEISNLTAGIYTFGVWAEDTDGIKSITFSFTTNVASGTTTTISGIFIPPTIDLSKDSVQKGETLNISGQTAPFAEVEVHVSSENLVEKVTATTVGDWVYNLNTSQLEEGVHSTRAKATTTDGLLSTFGQTLIFGVGVGLPAGKGTCPNADLNKDGRVNLIDFSILLYWWGRANECADQNSDGIVDLIDFSIMLYYWTG